MRSKQILMELDVRYAKSPYNGSITDLPKGFQDPEIQTMTISYEADDKTIKTAEITDIKVDIDKISQEMYRVMNIPLRGTIERSAELDNEDLHKIIAIKSITFKKQNCFTPTKICDCIFIAIPERVKCEYVYNDICTLKPNLTERFEIWIDAHDHGDNLAVVYLANKTVYKDAKIILT